jgi:preprotein translocase subunit SecG
MNPVPVDKGIFAVEGTELALFAAGAVVSIVVLVFALVLFIRAAREHDKQEKLEREEAAYRKQQRKT